MGELARCQGLRQDAEYRFFPARAAAEGAWVGQAGDRPRDAGHPDRGDAKLHVWSWEAGRGCQWAAQDAGEFRAAMQTLRHAKSKMKRRGALRAAEDAGPMARARLAVEQPGLLIGRLAVVGEAVLLAARTDEEAHQVAARPV
jgi:hypothetical protein